MKEAIAGWKSLCYLSTWRNTQMVDTPSRSFFSRLYNQVFNQITKVVIQVLFSKMTRYTAAAKPTFCVCNLKLFASFAKKPAGIYIIY